MLFLCLRSRFYKQPPPKSDGEWCWVQSSVPASCINPVSLMLVLFESWLPSDWLESLRKGTRSAGFDGQPRHLFTDMVILFRSWLHAPFCAKGKLTLWWCALIWRYESICLLPRRTFSCDSSRSLQTHSANRHVQCICHLWSAVLTLKNIPGSDSHTVTDAQPSRPTAKRRPHWRLC